MRTSAILFELVVGASGPRHRWRHSSAQSGPAHRAYEGKEPVGFVELRRPAPGPGLISVGYRY